TGGSGSGAIGTITVTAGAVTAVTITTGGSGYKITDTGLSASIAGGSGFSFSAGNVDYTVIHTALYPSYSITDASSRNKIFGAYTDQTVNVTSTQTTGAYGAIYWNP